MKTENEVRASIRGWVSRMNGKIVAEDLRDDTPIIERRIITSLQVMDLILYLEELRGRPVDVIQLSPGSFRDIDAIYRAFFEPGN
jgi:hypothetical protein